MIPGDGCLSAWPLARFEIKGGAVDAISLACGGWSIFENMAEMGITTCTLDLGTNHAVAAILNCLDGTSHQLI